MKKQKSAGRSALGLMASGVATIKLGQKMPDYEVRTIRGAMLRDRNAIRADAQRAFGPKSDREFA